LRREPVIATDLTFRRAALGDLPAIIAMLADDKLGQTREDPSDPPNPKYIGAFEGIEADPNQYMLVGLQDGAVIAYLQITFIPYVSRLGSLRGQIESVRVASHLRGGGIGKKLMLHAIDLCKERGCFIVHLTTDKTREQTKRFYERLGFEVSHHGMKLSLSS